MMGVRPPAPTPPLFMFSVFICVALLLSTCPTVRTEKENEYESSDDTNLVFVIVMFRHGDRTPVATYPTDPYKDRDNW